MPSNGPKVFLNYANEWRDVVEELASLLDKAGCNTWFDKKSLLAGQDWEREVEDAIWASDVFLACISREYTLGPRFLQKELRVANAVLERLPEGKAYVVPIRLEPNCQVPRALRKYQWCDYFQANGVRQVINAIAHHCDVTLIQPEQHEAWHAAPLELPDLSPSLVTEVTRLTTYTSALLLGYRTRLTQAVGDLGFCEHLAQECHRQKRDDERFDIEITCLDTERCYRVHNVRSPYWPWIVGKSFESQWSISQGPEFAQWFWSRVSTMDSGYLTWTDRLSSNALVERHTLSGEWSDYRRKTIASFRRLPIGGGQYWTIVVEGHEGVRL